MRKMKRGSQAGEVGYLFVTWDEHPGYLRMPKFILFWKLPKNGKEDELSPLLKTFLGYNFSSIIGMLRGLSDAPKLGSCQQRFPPGGDWEFDALSWRGRWIPSTPAAWMDSEPWRVTWRKVTGRIERNRSVEMWPFDVPPMRKKGQHVERTYYTANSSIMNLHLMVSYYLCGYLTARAATNGIRVGLCHWETYDSDRFGTLLPLFVRPELIPMFHPERHLQEE